MSIKFIFIFHIYIYTHKGFHQLKTVLKRLLLWKCIWIYRSSKIILAMNKLVDINLNEHASYYHSQFLILKYQKPLISSIERIKMRLTF